MFSVLLILVGIYVVYRLLSPSGYNSAPYPTGGYGRSGMGGMFGGMILGYLLTHYLIDQNQYDMWRTLDDDQLRDTLASEGILNDSDYDNLAGQATEGILPGYENSSDGNDWSTATSDYNDFNTNSYDDSGDRDDFGGFDS